MAFVGLVGLYACIVRRLEVRKRKPANFLALVFACCGLSCVCRLGCCGCCAPVLCLGCGLCCWLSFPIGQNEKRAHLFCALSLLGIGVFILNCLTL